MVSLISVRVLAVVEHDLRVRHPRVRAHVVDRAQVGEDLDAMGGGEELDERAVEVVDQVVGADIVTAYGGTVKVLGLVENSSTTAIVEKIRSR